MQLESNGHPTPRKTSSGPSLRADGLTGGKDRPWHLRAWSGIHFSAYCKILARNRFQISPTRIPMACMLTIISFCNSVLMVFSSIFFGERVRQTQLVDDPIFVLGHWRSGTTLLHELLCCDPRHTYPTTFTGFAANHFLLTEPLLKRLIRFALPDKRPMDNVRIGWDTPQEDEWALCNLGLPSPYFTILFPNRSPQFPEYRSLKTISEAQRKAWQNSLNGFLKSLTVRQSKRIVLKNPLHSYRVPALLEMYPNARFIHIVRDPYEVYASTMHTWRRMFTYQGLQVPRFEHLNEYVLENFEAMYRELPNDLRTIAQNRICELRYEDLLQDPVGQLKMIYQTLELGEFERAEPEIKKYASQMSEYRTNQHAMNLDLRDQISQRWSSFFVRYGYSKDSEPAIAESPV